MKQLPAFVFCVGLMLLALVIAFNSVPPHGLCAVSEGQPICLRDWVNALGNLITAAIAGAAATFAWQASSKQALVAALPALREQLREIGTICDQTQALRAKFRDFVGYLEAVASLIENGAALETLSGMASEFVSRQKHLEDTLKIVAEIGTDLRLRNGFEEEIALLVTNGWVGRATDMANIADFFQRIANVSDPKEYIHLAVRYQRLRPHMQPAAIDLRAQEIILETCYTRIRQRLETVNSKIGIAAAAV